MGSFDGAETCELVGSYLLSKLSPLLGNAVGLYRDDGFAALNKTPREIENIKKQICTTFNDHNLRLTIEANKKRVDYLDITLDLITGSYKPFNKPGNEIQYMLTAAATTLQPYSEPHLMLSINAFPKSPPMNAHLTQQPHHTRKPLKTVATTMSSLTSPSHENPIDREIEMLHD